MDYQNNGYQTGYAQGSAQAMDWDADFEAQETDRNPILTEGDYRFEIAKVERGRHNGQGKIPACNKATVTFRVFSSQGDVTIKENYYLLNEDWRIRMMTSFFASIGLADKETVESGGRIKPVWSNEIVGRRGVCHVAPRTYQKDGQDYQTNNLKYLYPMWDQPNVEPVPPRAVPAPNMQPAYQAPAAQQPYQQHAAQGYQQQYTPPVQGYQPPPPQGGYQQVGGYNPNNGGYGGGVY